ncbi:MAG: hypothetical protein QM775_31870 [Pirellulales bacterium]
MVDRYFTLSLLSSAEEPIDYDDDDGKQILLEVEISRNGVTRRASNVDELNSHIRKAGIEPSEYASSEPESLAAAISFLEDKGRIVREHPLFAEYAESNHLALSQFLPSWESPFLIWHELQSVNGSSQFVRRSLKV